MADNLKTTIVKLNNENYFNWKFRVELLLMRDDVWHVIDKPAPVLSNDRSNQSAVDAWKKSDDKARATIGLLVEDNQLNHIRNKTTAKQCWDALNEHHEKSTLSNKVILMRKICDAKMEEDGDMEAHIDGLTGLFQRLVALGETQLSDSWTVAMILSSLPSSYSTLVTALETRPEADLTLSLVESKLIGEYQRRKANECVNSRDNNDSVMKLSQKESMICFFCEQEGHFKVSCPDYIAWKEKQQKKSTEQAKLVQRSTSSSRIEQSEEYLFLASTFSHSSDCGRAKWIIDSAATSHASRNIESFTSIVHGDYKDAKLANGLTTKVFGKGSTQVNFVNESGGVSSVMVHDVLFTPNININLLSVSKLIAKGFEINFQGNACKIVSGGCTIGMADCRNKLYELRQSSDSGDPNQLINGLQITHRESDDPPETQVVSMSLDADLPIGSSQRVE